MNPIKTESLYGNERTSQYETRKRKKGFVYEVLWDIFDKINEESNESSVIVSISVWALKGNTIIE